MEKLIDLEKELMKEFDLDPELAALMSRRQKLEKETEEMELRLEK